MKKNEKEKTTSHLIAELEESVRWLATMITTGKNQQNPPGMIRDIVCPDGEDNRNCELNRPNLA